MTLTPALPGDPAAASDQAPFLDKSARLFFQSNRGRNRGGPQGTFPEVPSSNPQNRHLSFSTLMPHTSLPDAEADVLAAVYELGPATTADIRARLAARRPLAPASVATLLNRLAARGLVRRRRAGSGKAFVYTATKTRTRAFAGSLKRAMDVVQRGLGGSSVALVASLFETKKPTPDELRELERLVESYKEHR